MKTAAKKRSSLSALGALLLMLVIMSLLAAKPAHAKTFTVNSTQDFSDVNPGDGICDTTISSPSLNPCTLRAAIQETNANDNAPTVDIINFNIPNVADDELKTIKPTTKLPSIHDPVTINGYSQPGASPNNSAQGDNATLMIELDGTNAPDDADGLSLGSGSSNSVVKGLVINRFGSDGVSLGTSDSKVQGNFIGIDPTGTSDRGNGDSGVKVFVCGTCTVLPTGNRILRNSIFENGQLGIELNNDGVTATDPGGNASFTSTPSQAVAVGQVVTATSTDPGGNTSEFSLGKQVSQQ